MPYSATLVKQGKSKEKPPVRMKLSERNRIATHEKLLETGMKLFLTKGFVKTTATNIAYSAEVSVGTFYVHFKDKEALLREAWAKYVGEEIDNLRSIVVPQGENQPSQMAQRIRENAEALLVWVEGHRREFLFWTGPEVAAAALHGETSRTWTTWLEERIRTDASLGVKIPKDLSPPVAAQALLGICNRVLRWWLTSGSGSKGDSVKREDVINTLVRFHLAVYGISGD